ncbi:MAG: pentapeptide repeat-containing protein, partial [Candidatus Acidiferrum sp.]
MDAIVSSEKRRVGESSEMLAEIQESQSHLSAEEATGSISLIDLAEILDQHKIWVESGGESGVKADLCGVNLSHADLTGVNLEGAFIQRANLTGADLSMANLRGASLVQSELRDANLLGTELRGANLMGANLYGA